MQSIEYRLLNHALRFLIQSPNVNQMQLFKTRPQRKEVSRDPDDAHLQCSKTICITFIHVHVMLYT